MLYRFAVLALLLSVIAVQTRSEVRSAYTNYRLARVLEHVQRDADETCPAPDLETRIVDIDRTELDRMLEPTALMRQARIVPSITDSGTRGLRIYAVRPGGLFETLGVRNGDTLLSIDGHSLVDGQLPVAQYEPLADRDFVDLELDRAGSSVRIVVLIHG